MDEKYLETIKSIGVDAGKMVDLFTNFKVTDETTAKEVLERQGEIIELQLRIIAKFMKMHGVSDALKGLEDQIGKGKEKLE